MRIYTKRAFGFTNPNEGKEDKTAGIVVPEVVRTKPGEFQDVPDWCANDSMFKWGVADGDIEVIAVKPTVAAKAAPAEKAA